MLSCSHRKSYKQKCRISQLVHNCINCMISSFDALLLLLLLLKRIQYPEYSSNCICETIHLTQRSRRPNGLKTASINKLLYDSLHPGDLISCRSWGRAEKQKSSNIFYPRFPPTSEIMFSLTLHEVPLIPTFHHSGTPALLGKAGICGCGNLAHIWQSYIFFLIQNN